MGLVLALTASASPPTLAVDNEAFQEFSDGHNANLRHMYVGGGDMMITDRYHDVFYTISGNDAVPEQSDHPFVSNEAVKKYLVIEEGSTVATVNGNLLNSDVNISALAAVDDRQRSCYESMNVNGYSALDLDLENSNGLAAVVEPERRTCSSDNVMKDTYNDLDPSKTDAGLPLVGEAQHSRHMVWVLKRPAWTMPRYLRC